MGKKRLNLVLRVGAREPRLVNELRNLGFCVTTVEREADALEHMGEADGFFGGITPALLAVIENARRFRDGEPLLNVVDKERGFVADARHLW